MLSDLTPTQITLLALAISIEIYNSFDNTEANAINNLITLISANLSVQLAQESLLQDKKNNDKPDNVQPLSAF